MPMDFFGALQTLLRRQLSLILAHLNSVQSADPLRLFIESGQKSQLRLDSNGGAKADLGSFGWELAVGPGSPMNRSWDNPNHCLASECNLESGLVDISHHLPVNFSCNHCQE